MAKLMAEPASPPMPTRADPARFSCVLREQPTHLVPERLLKILPSYSGVPLSLNPHCTICLPGEFPAEVVDREAWQVGFALDDATVAWVHDPVREVWSPFWLTPELASALSRSEEDPDLPEDVRVLLVQAGILVFREQLSRTRKQWSLVADRCRTRFASGGNVAMSGLIHPFHLGALRRYYRHQVRTGLIRLGDQQSARRYVAHNDPVARFFHQQLAGVVTDIAGEAVKPSYVYFASYQSGAELHKHTDREQCEFSITLCVDYAPEPASATPWPLHLDTQEGTVTVYQALGDALIYRGRELPHYRRPLPPRHTSTSIFFHYVREGFRGQLS